MTDRYLYSPEVRESRYAQWEKDGHLCLNCGAVLELQPSFRTWEEKLWACFTEVCKAIAEKEWGVGTNVVYYSPTGIQNLLDERATKVEMTMRHIEGTV